MKGLAFWTAERGSMLEKRTQLQQTVTPACGTDFTANVGAARIPRGELEVAAIVSTGFRFGC